MPMVLGSRIAAVAVATMLLLVPAIWNGFPLLFYDSGAYLGRAFSDTLSPGRSAVYGFFLGAGHWPDFWPVVLVQSVVTVWTVALMLRTHNIGHRPILLVGLFALFTAATSLPWLAGQLMPDLFAGLSVLASYLLVFRAGGLARWERFALVALVAFGAASHNATLAVLAAMLAAGIVVKFIAPRVLPAAGLVRVLFGIMLGAALLLTANFAVTGRIAWTPGGTAFVFGRLIEDGIVHEFLEDNCPDLRYELCKYRARLPHHVNDFLWRQGENGAFAMIGGFEDGAEEMRDITLESLWQYPGMHFTTAVRSTLAQLFAVGTGYGIMHDVWDAYGHIESLTPEAVPAAHSARQRHGELEFDKLNQLHVPVAWVSMAAIAVLLLGAWRRRRIAYLDPLAATIGIALLANAFVCGVFSNAHDRYGARIVWIATLFVAIAVARLAPAFRAAPRTPIPQVTTGSVPAAARLPILPRKVKRP